MKGPDTRNAQIKFLSCIYMYSDSKVIDKVKFILFCASGSRIGQFGYTVKHEYYEHA